MAFSTEAFATELRIVGCEIWERGDADIEETFNFHPDDPSHPDNMKISRQLAEQRKQERTATVQPAGNDTDGRDEQQAKLRAIGEEYIGIDGNTYLLGGTKTFRVLVINSNTTEYIRLA
jgi:FKBP-type peptidyl-prolyl cis-trans isomerase 2